MKTLFLGMLLAGLVIISSSVKAQVDGSLVLYLPFDEGSGDVAKDFSQYHNDGAVKGPKWVSGKFGKALEFDGVDDIVDCGNNKVLNVPNAMTLEAWVKPLKIHTSWIRIIQKCSVAGVRESWALIFMEASQKIRVEFFKGGTQRKVDALTDVPLLSWSHVAGTYDGRSLKLYLNGVLDSTSDFPTQMDIGTNDLNVIVGASIDDPRYFAGVIDEVRVWDRALSEKEIYGNMNKGKGELLAVNKAGKLTTTWASIKKQ